MQVDWSRTALGAPQLWPHDLRLLVNVILAADAPMFVAWGAELNMIYNQAYAPILGLRHPAALGQPLSAVWPEGGNGMQQMIEQVWSGKTCSVEDTPAVLQRNGKDEQVWFSFSFSPVFGNDATVNGVFCAIRETTAEVLARQAHEREIRRLRSIFDNAPGMLLVLRGPDHVFEVANKAYCNFVGRNDLIGNRVCDVLPELCEQGYLDILDSVYREGKAHLAQAMPVTLTSPVYGTKEQFFFDFIYQPMKDDDGRVFGIFAEGIDITATFTAAAALRESERRYRGLMDVVPMLIWIGRNDQSLVYCNQQWYDYTGLQPSQTWDRGWDHVIHPDHRHEFAQAWDEGKRLGIRWRANVPLRRAADGEFHWHMVQAIPVRDDDGAIAEWVGIAVNMLNVDPDAQYAGEVPMIRPGTH